MSGPLRVDRHGSRYRSRGYWPSARTLPPSAHSPRIYHKVTGAEALGLRKPVASVSPEE